MANIIIHNLSDESDCQELTISEQATIKGGSWLKDAVRWVVKHIGVKPTNGGVIVKYKGSHDLLK